MLFQPNFTETKIATKFGDFNIRVYPDEHSRETIVLWAEPLRNGKPPLVRVHSECITGDMMGSLQCDCGKQLNKSLQLIQEEGGILIYLRQEGRGIGLFEKIKAYQLQANGYDTFEANTVLGHRPDERTYEMAKVVLDDFGIDTIRLLTNNPSKVSELAKLGITVAERIPLIIKPNKHNRRYFKTKQEKFQHLFDAEPGNYFYQFPIDQADELKEIITFIEKKTKDPLLLFYVALTADLKTLSSKEEISRIQSLIKLCNKHEHLVPILHFSFQSSFNISSDLDRVKKAFPSLKNIQLNDLPLLAHEDLSKACSLFAVTLPLCKKHFEKIHEKPIRNVLRKNNAFITLDESKGRGLTQSTKSMKKKIDTLLSYGLHNIGLCGGYGPDELDQYFELRRYYRINLSIDAETKLKNGDKVDIDKIKYYLSQLIRFDDPKEEGIEQTRQFLKDNLRSDWDTVLIEGQKFLIHPKVFHAGQFPSTAWFSKTVNEVIKGSKSFCEVGCGSGVITCLAALDNPEMHVVATDINGFASENTKVNAKNLGIKNQVQVFSGDVLDSIPKGTKFDYIFWALPFGFLDPGTEVDLIETQVFDPGYRAIRKFFETAHQYINPKGKLLIGFSSDLGNYQLLESLADQAHAIIKVLARTKIQEEIKLEFELLELSYEKKHAFEHEN